MGVRELHIDWWVKVVPAFWERQNYPNIGMGGGLLGQILILLQTLFFHFAYVTRGRQLTKVILWVFSLGTGDPSPYPFQALE